MSALCGHPVRKIFPTECRYSPELIGHQIQREFQNVEERSKRSWSPASGRKTES